MLQADVGIACSQLCFTYTAKFVSNLIKLLVYRKPECLSCKNDISICILCKKHTENCNSTLSQVSLSP